MDWLNYHHLLYFWTVVREGGVSRASERLRLAQPTVSAQLRGLEDALGDRLFVRSGRQLILTDFGRMVYQYAERIFSTGQELMRAVRGRLGGQPLRLTVGLNEGIPKTLVQRLLAPVLGLPEPVHLVCREDTPEHLLALLSTHDLDVMLSDTALRPPVRVKVFEHELGSSPVSFFAARPLAARLRRRFPRSLDGAPFLLPLADSALRQLLEDWFARLNVAPRVVAEIQDSALVKVFGKHGGGVFAAPAIVAADVRRTYGVALVGQTDEIQERFYAISLERNIRHGGLLELIRAARQDLFRNEASDAV